MIAKSNVILAARLKADDLRYSQGSSKPESREFDFSEQNEGRVSVSEDVEFRFSAIMPVGKPAATHTILLNSWDYRQVPMKQVPDFDLAIQLAMDGPPNEIKGRLQSFQSLMSDFKSVLSDFGSMLQMDSLGSFFGGFINNSELLQKFALGAQHDQLIGGTQRQQMDSQFQIQAGQLVAENETISEIKTIYEQLLGLQSTAKERQRENSTKAVEAAKNLEDSLTGLDEALGDAPESVEELEETLADSSLSKEDKLEAVDEMAAEIEEALDQIDAKIAAAEQKSSPDERGPDGRSAMRRILDEAVVATVRPNIGPDVDRAISKIPGLSAAQKDDIRKRFREALQKSSGSFDKYAVALGDSIRKLRAAVDEGDTEAQDAAMALLSTQTARLQAIVKTAAKAVAGMTKQTEAAIQ